MSHFVAVELAWKLDPEKNSNQWKHEKYAAIVSWERYQCPVFKNMKNPCLWHSYVQRSSSMLQLQCSPCQFHIQTFCSLEVTQYNLDKLLFPNSAFISITALCKIGGSKAMKLVIFTNDTCVFTLQFNDNFHWFCLRNCCAALLCTALRWGGNFWTLLPPSTLSLLVEDGDGVDEIEKAF